MRRSHHVDLPAKWLPRALLSDALPVRAIVATVVGATGIRSRCLLSIRRESEVLL